MIEFRFAATSKFLLGDDVMKCPLLVPVKVLNMLYMKSKSNKFSSRVMKINYLRP